ncbi:MAG: hypothetical protein ACFCBU_05885 [Cyanophyceae cyanobacterium]
MDREISQATDYWNPVCLRPQQQLNQPPLLQLPTTNLATKVNAENVPR